MNYTDLMNIFNYRDYDESNMWAFGKIVCHGKFPDDDWVLKVIWETGKKSCQHTNTKKVI